MHEFTINDGKVAAIPPGQRLDATDRPHAAQVERARNRRIEVVITTPPGRIQSTVIASDLGPATPGVGVIGDPVVVPKVDVHAPVTAGATTDDHGATEDKSHGK